MKIDLNIFDLFKLPAKVFTALVIATGIILFIPDSTIQTLYMKEFRDKYGFVISIVFIVSLSIVAVSIIATCFRAFVGRYNEKKFFKKGRSNLTKLDQYSKTLIWGLYEIDNHTHDLPMNDGAVMILTQKRMITRTTNTVVTSAVNPQCPYVLQPWVIEQLDGDQELRELFEQESHAFDNRNNEY